MEEKGPRSNRRSWDASWIIVFDLRSLAKMSKSTKQTKRTTATGASSGGKVKKKKWSKGKAKDKANNLVIFDKSLYDRVFKEVSLYKLITPSVLVDRHHINCSLARALLKELLAKGLIVKVAGHHAQMIYTRASSRAEGAKAPKEIPAETGASDASA